MGGQMVQIEFLVGDSLVVSLDLLLGFGCRMLNERSHVCVHFTSITCKR